MLGVDAAWTAHNPSGIALAAESAGGWRLLKVAPSYAHFLGAADPGDRPTGQAPDAAALLNAAARIAGRSVDLVAIDMPLSHRPIVGRRASDRLVSSAFSRRGAATHSPSATRPGALSDALREQFDRLGYRLAVTPPDGPAIAEVYPHPALIAFLQDNYRLPYKAGRMRQYWPDLADLHARREKLFAVWTRILIALDARISGVAAALPPPGAATRLKPFEDQLDAIVCAAIAIEILEGRAQSFGDADSAIWVPKSAVQIEGRNQEME